MLQLYTSEYCPYCKRVEAYMEEAGIEYEERNVQTDTKYRDELIEKGGKMQVPFLVDTEKGTQMYESEDMVAYLATNYAGKTDKT